MKQLQQLQREIGKWSQDQFGDNISKATGYPLGSQNALTGIVEEVGELNHVTICHHQGRRGYDNSIKYKADRDDALADILIFMCDYAEREGTDLLTLLNQTWDKVVSKRTTENWDQHTHQAPVGATISEQRMREEMEQTGAGWAEPKEQDEVDSSKKCSVCGLSVHRTNSTGLCTGCFVRAEAKREHNA